MSVTNPYNIVAFGWIMGSLTTLITYPLILRNSGSSTSKAGRYSAALSILIGVLWAIIGFFFGGGL